MSDSTTCDHCGVALPTPTLLPLCPKCSALAVSETLEPENDPTVPINPDFSNTIDHYEVIHEIARGGMGIVFKVRDPKLNRCVALKRIHESSLKSPSAMERFKAEAASVARLDHPSIVPIYDICIDHSIPFFTMKLIDGTPLSGTAHPTIDRADEERIALMIAKIAQGVHHAHQRGILHRDLKPSNIIVDNDGSPHITDFGLAKNLDDPVDLTLTGAILGTPNYMAPEQARGDGQAITVAADVYALGGILYQQLTGEAPFQDQSALRVLEKVVHEDASPPERIQDHIDPDLSLICTTCLEKEPHRRYPSAAALADDLERWIRGEPIRARRIGIGERVWKWAKRKPAWAALWTLTLISSTVILFMALDHQAKLSDKQKETEAAYTQLNRNLTNIESDAAERAFESASSPLGFAYLAKILRRSPSHTATLRRSLSALKSRAIATPLKNTIRRQRVTNAPEFNQSSTLGAALDRNRALIFDPQTGGVISDAPSHNGRLRLVEFSPDGTRLAVGDHGNYMSLWDTETWTQVGQRMPHDGRITKTLYSPTGKWFTTVGYDGLAKLWDGKNGSPISDPLQHPRTKAVMNVIQFWPNQDWLLTGNVLGKLALWRLPEGELIHEFAHHDPYISSILFHPTGSHFVSLGTASVRAWNTKTYQSERVFPHSGTTFYAEFDADGTHLFTASFDRRLRVWDFKTANLIPRFFGFEIETPNLAINHSRNLLAVHSQGIVSVWNMATRRLVTDTISTGEEILSTQFTPDGRHLAVASSSMEISFWKIPSAPSTSERNRVDSAEDGLAGTPQFVPGTQQLLVSLKGKSGVQLWDPQTAEMSEQLPLTNTTNTTLRSASVNSSGNHLYVESSDQMGYLLGLNPLRLLSRFELQTGAPSKVARLNDSGDRLIVVADRVQSSDSWLVDPQDGQVLRPLATHDTRPSLTSVMSHGNRFLIGETFEKIYLGDFDDPKPASHTFPDRAAINRLEMGTKTDLIAIGRTDGQVEVLESQRPPTLRFSVSHNGAITSLKFNRDNSLLASAATDGTVQVRSTTTGELPTRPLPHSRSVLFADFHVDPTLIVTLTADAQLSYWDINMGHVIWRERLTIGVPTHVSMDSQCEWLALRTSDSREHTIRLPRIDAYEKPASPEWFPDLIEAVGGLRLVDNDAHLSISQNQRREILQSILTIQADDPILTWAKRYINARFEEWLDEPVTP